MKQGHVSYTREEVVAENGVVAAGHPFVSRIGVERMKRGGNAINAAVAVAFTAQIAEIGMCGLGGNSIILVHCGDKDETTVFDDTSVPPAAATPDMFEVLPGTGGFGRPTAVSTGLSGLLHTGADPMYSTVIAGF